MSSVNGSSAYYFITYIIYAFGQNIKFGTIDKNSQLVLHGNSATSSGSK